jgi:tripartite-type tricarboxylate transporter receptor subunit TctC
MAEAGLPGFDTTSWFCIVGPAGLPPAIVTRLNSEIVKILNAGEVREKLIAAGVNVESSTPEGLRAFVRDEIRKMRKSVKFSGATVD